MDSLLGTIERNADRMQRVVGDILEIARFRTGQVVLQLRRFDASALARGAVAVGRAPRGQARPDDRARRAGARRSGSTATTVGWSRRSSTWSPTPSRTRPEGGRSRSAFARRASSVTWTVTDEGPGSRTTTRRTSSSGSSSARTTAAARGGGVGLGLPTALAIAQAHGGRIDVDERRRAYGSMFSLVVPADGPPGRRVMRILVVDDAPDVVESVRLGFTLQWREVEVLGAGTGEEALDVVERERPDIVLLDVGLPGLDGFGVLREIRAFSDVPVRHAHGARRRDGQGQGPGAGRRRLRDEAVQPPRADGARAGRPAPPRHAAADQPRAVVPGRATSRSTSPRHEARLRGERLELTPTEYKLLYHLVRNAGHVLQHGTLLAKVWGREYLDEVDYLRVYVRRLRDKLGDDPDHPRYIRTERGLGYRFIAARG